jgi:hypothetical protein
MIIPVYALAYMAWLIYSGPRAMILRKGLLRRKFEGRNVIRSLVVSRRDNNDMWYMAEQLEGIVKPISKTTHNPFPTFCRHAWHGASNEKRTDQDQRVSAPTLG